MFSKTNFKFFLIIICMVSIQHIASRCSLNIHVENGIITHWQNMKRGIYVCNSRFTGNGTGGMVRCRDNEWTITTECTDCGYEDKIQQLGLYHDDEINFIFHTKDECQQQCTRDGCNDFMYYQIGGFCFLNFNIGLSKSISLQACRKSCLEHPSCKAIQKLGNQCFLYSKNFSSYTGEEAAVATSCL